MKLTYLATILAAALIANAAMAQQGVTKNEILIGTIQDMSDRKSVV